MIVLDASAAIELLLALPLSKQVQDVVAAHDWQLAAPQLLEIEVLQVLRRRVASGRNLPAEAAEALDLLRDLNIRYFDHKVISGRIWELRENLTAYDAAYIALAELLEAPLLTTDIRLVNAPGHSARCLQLGI